MELATAHHHSAQRPGKKVVEEPEEEEVHVTHDALRGLKTPRPQIVAVGRHSWGRYGWLPRAPRCPLSRCRRWVTMLVTTPPRLSSSSGAPWKEAEAELFLQSARLYRAVEGKWELDGAGDAKLFHNSVIGLSSFTFVYEHNHQSLSSDIVDDAPYCELKLRGQSSCYWLEPSGSRHRLTFASKDFCAKFNEVFDEAKRLSRGGAD